MEQVITLVCKLQPTDEQAQHLDETLRRFAEACTYVHTTLPADIRNKDRMQAMIYYDVRSRFGLSANLMSLGALDFVDQLPRSEAGKLLVAELRARYWPAAQSAGTR